MVPIKIVKMEKFCDATPEGIFYMVTKSDMKK